MTKLYPWCYSQTISRCHSQWVVPNHFYELVMISSHKCRWFSMTGSLHHPGKWRFPHPKQHCLPLFLQHITGEARAGKSFALRCSTSALLQPFPSNKCHSAQTKPLEPRWDRKMLQTLIWCCSVVCNALSCYCRQNHSSWSRGLSMLLILTAR